MTRMFYRSGEFTGLLLLHLSSIHTKSTRVLDYRGIHNLLTCVNTLLMLADERLSKVSCVSLLEFVQSDLWALISSEGWGYQQRCEDWVPVSKPGVGAQGQHCFDGKFFTSAFHLLMLSSTAGARHCILTIDRRSTLRVTSLHKSGRYRSLIYQNQVYPYATTYIYI